MNTTDELAATKEALNKVTQEMDAIRDELTKMRGGPVAKSDYAFGFDPVEFNAMNYTRGLAWIAAELAPRVKDEAAKHQQHFWMTEMFGNIKPMGVRICARFNRGESCKPSWHAISKPNKQGQGQHRELRLHCCAVCVEAFEVLTYHHLLSCPWLKPETWLTVEKEESEQV